MARTTSQGEEVTFSASLPPILSAIKTGDDGARVQFDVPETDMDAIKRLMDWKRRELHITVRAVG